MTKTKNQTLLPQFLGAVIVSIIISALISWFLIHQTISSKLAYIETDTLLQEYQGMVDVRREVQAEAKKLKAETDTFYQNLQTIVQDFEKNRSKLSGDKLEKLEADIAHRQNQFKRLRENSEQQLMKIEQEATSKVVEEMNLFLEDYCEQQNYQLVFGVMGQGNLIYADKGINITQEVLAEINKQFQSR